MPKKKWFQFCESPCAHVNAADATAAGAYSRGPSPPLVFNYYKP